MCCLNLASTKLPCPCPSLCAYGRKLVSEPHKHALQVTRDSAASGSSILFSTRLPDLLFPRWLLALHDVARLCLINLSK